MVFNRIKPVIAILAVAVLLASFCSCQLSKIIGNDQTSESDSLTEEPNTESESTEPSEKYEPMDFKIEDVSKFITLGNYKNFKLQTKSDIFTEEEFRETIEEILKQNGVPAEITDRVTEKGDVLNIDFTGFLDGVQFEGGTASSRSISLSDNTGYIPGFDADLYGIMPGTTVETRVKFPSDYENSVELRDKEVTFKIKVNYIYGENVKADYTDEFVQKITDGEYKTVKEFEEYYFELLKKHKVVVVREEEKQSAWDAFIDSLTIIEIPQKQIDYYYYNTRQQYEFYAAMYGITYEQMLAYSNLTDETLKKRAYDNALSDVALEAICRVENITLSDDEYSSMLNEYAENLNTTAEQIEKQYDKETLKSYFVFDKAKKLLVSYSEFTVVENNDSSETQSSAE